ncbi:hypothetical protein FEM48_Zijuj07G0002700 [Ziziphus jujuba var. spinosa]|uniref:Uncharacterized protein n=1 Tax=Ziziphus jujuba var. spinosa TaxID=714518 RepID=A0A978V1B7_ZIZJJ|nr:hypothetical protein FEM48_Zijuj07G0002700 [Ziziphus jujuba var. spinosa]
MLIKIDVKKAYDGLKWAFITKALKLWGSIDLQLYKNVLVGCKAKQEPFLNLKGLGNICKPKKDLWVHGVTGKTSKVKEHVDGSQAKRVANLLDPTSLGWNETKLQEPCDQETIEAISRQALLVEQQSKGAEGEWEKIVAMECFNLGPPGVGL